MEDPVESLLQETTCSICLEYFRDPVSIPCGHSFCRTCIAECWEERSVHFSCPQCRELAPKRDFRPNRELGNVVEITKRLSLHASEEARGGGGGGEGKALCEKHREALKLFCTEEEVLICCICRESRAHRSHDVLPVEEAAQDYKNEIRKQLESLRGKFDKLMELNLAGKLRQHEYLRQAEVERQKALSEFVQVHRFLEEQERLLLAQLSELEREIAKHQEEHDTKLSKEKAFLGALTYEVARKCGQTDSEFLQDIRSTLCSFEKELFQPPEEMPEKVEKRLREFSEKNMALAEIMKNLKDNLPSELGTERVNVILDVETANSQIVISEDRKTARWGLTLTNMPHNPKQFMSSCCVLGCEGFDSGRHYWEVNVESGGIWVVGVARGSVKRNVELSLTPEEGIWALQRDFYQCKALTVPITPLPLSSDLRRIRVSLDYEREQVEFLNADTKDSIFVFPSASFSGEKVFPFFKVLFTQLTLEG